MVSLKKMAYRYMNDGEIDIELVIIYRGLSRLKC